MGVINLRVNLNYFSGMAVIFMVIGLIIALVGIANGDGTLATAGAVFPAISGLFLALGVRQEDQTRAKSQFCLDECRRVLEKASATLESGTNLRVEWIKAARLIYRGQKLASYVTENDHKDALDAFMEEYRVRVLGVLGAEDGKIAGSFFYGVDPTLDMSAAAQKSSDRRGRVISTNNWIPESALTAIYDFVKYPQDYSDPMPERKFSRSELRSLSALQPAMHEYIQHTDKYYTMAGVVKERPEPREREG